MNGNRKQITFDLSPKALAEHYPRSKSITNPKFYKKAYADISRFMKRNGFEQRQFLVYISTDRLTTAKVVSFMQLLAREMPWFVHYVNQIDVTNISAQHSLLQVLKNEDNLEAEMPQPQQAPLKPPETKPQL